MIILGNDFQTHELLVALIKNKYSRVFDSEKNRNLDFNLCCTSQEEHKRRKSIKKAFTIFLLFPFTWRNMCLEFAGILVFMKAKDRASDRSRRKKSNFAGFLEQIRGKIGQFRGNFAWNFRANFTKKQSVKNGWFCGYFQGKFCWRSIGFALIRSSFSLSTTIRSRNEPMNIMASASFSQHNRLLVVLGCCLHVSVTKFQDKFASLQQVDSPNSWNKFQICCTGIYLIRFLPISRYFACFCEFRGILRIFLNFTALQPREKSEAL